MSVSATVDIVLFMDPKDESGDPIGPLRVLLIKRGNEPHKGEWAFPGGRVDATDSDLHSAALRELREEVNLVDIELEYIKTVGNNRRDPRGFTITNIYMGLIDEEEHASQIVAGDDAVDYKWFDVTVGQSCDLSPDLPKMAFDHREILEEVANRYI